uniref:NB-ARC domain-containing protein n=1 Tax=Oryza rufipogon TaxID=4529 RepID=A0A0E0QW10_ORYRU
MSRRPYDAYLYTDNFMFGRHTEKQRLLNFLLEYNSQGLPPVLPIIGSLAVGKKTLVAHVCADERVQSQFSSILHLNEDDLLRLAHSDTLLSGKMLVVVEFVSDLNEKNWEEFYTSLTQMNQGSKVITISRFRKSEKLGTVKPIALDIHSYEELSYLFKTLAFGSVNPKDHPRLLQIAEEFAMQLQLKSSLVAANFLADVLRRNLDVNFWLCMLNRCITVAEKNFSLYGEQTRLLLEQGHRVDITNFDSSPAAPLHIVPCVGANSTGKDLPRVKFTELLLDPSVRPKDDLLRIAHSDTLLSGKMLVVVEFVSDLNEKNWEEFYTSLAQMNEGSKVITISRFRKSEKLGTVKPILLDIHSHEELTYLFKTLAFGSANPMDHPRLLQVAEEFAMQLQLRGSLISVNICADVLRWNLDVNFWISILNRCITVAEKNFSLYGKHVRSLFEQGHRLDITNFASSSAAPLHIIPFAGHSSALKDLQRVTLRELLLDPSVRPKGDFVHRFISFLIKKCESQENLETKMERLHNLLLKAHMIVEEAEGRYITNSKMLLQFKKIVETMYQGYHILDIIKHRTLCSSRPEEEVSNSNTLSTRTCYVDPFHTSQSYTIRHDQLQSTLDSLETIVSSMTEFVILLGGCERMSPKPYDTYLYFDNFMYGRQVEKQQVISILLQENIPHFAPTVLPRSLALVELVREL